MNAAARFRPRTSSCDGIGRFGSVAVRIVSTFRLRAILLLDALGRLRRAVALVVLFPATRRLVVLTVDRVRTDIRRDADRGVPLANLRAPSQERADTAGRFEQSRVFNKRYGSASLLGFRHQQIGQGRLPWFFAFRSSLRIGDLRR